MTIKTAWVFPGQGAQKVGMGRALYESSARAKEIFDQADEALGYSLSKLCFEGPADELMLTANTQPALVTMSIAALRAIQEQYPQLPAPAFAAGHSLGEYSALVASGALQFQDAVKLVHLRGSAMQQAVPQGEGAMLAIMGGDTETVSSLCEDAKQSEVLSPANFNCPGQIVIAGTKDACDRARELAKDRKLKAIPLKVSAPFHCALMAPAAEAVRVALKDIALGEMRFPVVSNVEGTANQDASRVAELLVSQIDGPVRWQQSVEWMGDAGVTQFLEIGSGKVLAGLIKKTAPDLRSLSVGDPETIAQIAEFMG